MEKIQELVVQFPKWRQERLPPPKVGLATNTKEVGLKQFYLLGQPIRVRQMRFDGASVDLVCRPQLYGPSDIPSSDASPTRAIPG
jgi:hypothetical protein